MNKLVKHIFPKKAFQSSYLLSNSIPILKFSETKPQSLAKTDPFVLAAPFYSILSQYQISKDKKQTQEAEKFKLELINHAEIIVSQGKYDPKLFNNLALKLHQESLMNEKILAGLLNLIEDLPYNLLHKLDFNFGLVVLKYLDKSEVEINEKQVKQLQSLIVYILSSNQWNPIKEFLDVVTSEKVYKKYFNEEIEAKIIKILNYARTQISDLPFFVSIMQTAHNTIMKGNDRYNLKIELEKIMELKIIDHQQSIDTDELENIMSFFSQNYLLSNQFFYKISPAFFESKRQIGFAAFKNFIEVAGRHNYNISQNPPDYLIKILSYIDKAKSLEDLKIFSPYLKYYTPSQSSLLTNNISSAIGRNLDQLFKSSQNTLNELLLLKFYLETTDTRAQSDKIIALLDNFVTQNRDKLPLSSLAVVSLLSNYLPKEKQVKFEPIEEIIIQRLTKETMKNIDQEIILTAKQFLQSYYYSEDMTPNKKSILSKIEILLKDSEFLRKIQFRDLYELLQFLYYAYMNKIVNKTYSQDFWEKYKEPFFLNLKLEEIIFILPKAARLPWILNYILQPINKHIEKIMPIAPLTFDALLRILESMSSFEDLIINDREIRKNAKTFWFACEESFCNQITVVVKKMKVKNPFAESWDKVNQTKSAAINTNLTLPQLMTTFKIYDYIIKWNIGSKAVFDTLHVLVYHYFDTLDSSTLSRLAHHLATILNPKEKEELQAKFEQFVIARKASSPIEYVRFAWYFAVKGNQNQELWTTLVDEISKMTSVKEQPVDLMLNLYEILFMIRVELSSVKIAPLEKFFEDLDEVWTREHREPKNDFKENIKKVLEEECYILEPNYKASLYDIDYCHNEKDIVIVLGGDCFIGNMNREKGHVILKKRILKGLGYELHVIDKINFENKKKFLEKMDYVKKQMQGIPIDKLLWTKKQKQKGIFF